MTSADTIVRWYQSRLRDRSTFLQRAHRAADLYNQDIVLPLPEIDRVEEPAIKNYAEIVVDQHGARIGSVMPTLAYPPRRRGVEAAEKRARLQREANYGWWGQSRIQFRIRRMARWLVGYGNAPLVVLWDFEQGIPRFEERNPVATFARETNSPADIGPSDAIFATSHDIGTLRSFYGDTKVRELLRGQPLRDVRPDEQFTVLEYFDADERVKVGVAKRMPGEAFPPDATTVAVELDRAPNPMGVCPVVVPGNINLDRQKGAIDSLYGLFIKQAKLDALKYIAIKDEVFAKEWLEGHAGEIPKIIREADGQKGIRGIVRGGRINRQTLDVTLLAANNVEDRLEETARTVGAPAQFTGMLPTNTRTGAASESTIAALTDFPIQERQELIAFALEEANRRAVKLARARTTTKVSLFVPWRGVDKEVSYDASDLVSEESRVTYTLPGLGIQEYPVAISNRLALGTLSRKSAIEMDPINVNGEAELDQVTAEALEQSVLAEIQTPGSASLTVKARVAELVASDREELFSAVMKAQQEEQERQAQQVAAPPGSPESQPGIGPAGQPLVNPQVAGPLDELALLFQDQRGIQSGV